MAQSVRFQVFSSGDHAAIRLGTFCGSPFCTEIFSCTSVKNLNSNLRYFRGFNSCYIVLPRFTNPHKGKLWERKSDNNW